MLLQHNIHHQLLAKNNLARDILISRFAVADRIYISSSGSDSNDGSEESPFLTLDHAYLQATDGQAIIDLDGGSYTISPTYITGGYGGQASVFHKNVSFIGIPNATTVTNQDTPNSRLGLFGMTDSSVVIAFAIINYKIYGRSGVNIDLIRRDNSQDVHGMIVSCVVKCLTTGDVEGSTSFSRLGGGSTVQIDRSLLLMSFFAPNTSTTTAQLSNTACNNAITAGSTTLTNNIENVTVDVDYQITHSSLDDTSHLYWRILCTERNNENWFEVAELECYDTYGSLISPTAMMSATQDGYTLFASSTLTGWDTWEAFDGTASGTLRWVHESGEAVPHHLGFSAPTAINIHSIKLAPHSSYSPKDFSIEFSDDGTSWNEKWSIEGVTSGWAARTLREFVIGDPNKTQGVYSGFYSWDGPKRSDGSEFIFVNDNQALDASSDELISSGGFATGDRTDILDIDLVGFHMGQSGSWMDDSLLIDGAISGPRWFTTTGYPTVEPVFYFFITPKEERFIAPKTVRIHSHSTTGRCGTHIPEISLDGQTWLEIGDPFLFNYNTTHSFNPNDLAGRFFRLRSTDNGLWSSYYTYEMEFEYKEVY